MVIEKQKGNPIIITGFILLGIFIYLVKIQGLFNDKIALGGYLVGCAILGIGLIMNKRGRK